MRAKRKFVYMKVIGGNGQNHAPLSWAKSANSLQKLDVCITAELCLQLCPLFLDRNCGILRLSRDLKR